jgi:Ca2+/Na+ antiporter
VPLAILLLAVGAVLVGVGAPLAGRAVATPLRRRSIAPEPVVATVVGVLGAGAATVIATGRGQTALAGGIPFGATMFLLAAAFGAAGLLGRRPVELGDPVAVAVPAAAFLLAAAMAQDRFFERFEGAILAAVEVPFLAWVVAEDAAERADPEPVSANPGGEAPPRASGGWGAVGAGALGVALAVGGAALLVEGAVRVAARAPLVPGFAGATLVGTLTALPFVLTVVFPRRRAAGDAVRGTLQACVALVTLAPGVAAIVRPFELDAPATVGLLGAAGMYAACAAWLLVRGRAGRVLGALVLAGYAAWLVYAGSL